MVSWKPYFFSPLHLEDIQDKGWGHIYNQQDPGIAETIFNCEYLILPVTTGDHWFLIIVTQFDKLCKGEKSAIYVLDSNHYDWDEIHEPMIRVLCDAARAASGGKTKHSDIEFFQASPDSLPQQKGDFCGYYLMAYLEVFAREPNAFLQRIKVEADQEELDPGAFEEMLLSRFLKLLEDFQEGKAKNGSVSDRRGRPLIDGKLNDPLTEYATEHKNGGKNGGKKDGM
ncbi:hypothetical protein BJX99DRAFT_265990 [Aspergillus californicus]